MAKLDFLDPRTVAFPSETLLFLTPVIELYPSARFDSTLKVPQCLNFSSGGLFDQLSPRALPTFDRRIMSLAVKVLKNPNRLPPHQCLVQAIWKEIEVNAKPQLLK